MQKLIKNGTIILLLGLVGLIVMFGYVFSRYACEPKPPHSATAQQIAQMDIGRININTADETTLAAIPNLSRTQAQAIIAYREEHGSFSSVAELMNVKGIGKTTYQRIEYYVTVE